MTSTKHCQTVDLTAFIIVKSCVYWVNTGSLTSRRWLVMKMICYFIYIFFNSADLCLNIKTYFIGNLLLNLFQCLRLAQFFKLVKQSKISVAENFISGQIAILQFN